MSDAPDGTMPWRKSWRRRWRPDSTYRQLTLLQRAVLQYVEDNADEQGRVVVTTDQLREYVSSPRERIGRSTVNDAVRRLSTLGLIETGQQTGRQAGRTPLTITRVNWEKFQGGAVEAGQQTGQQTGSSSRGVQKKQKKNPAGAGPDGVAELVRVILAEFKVVTGEEMLWRGPDYGVLQQLRKTGVPDAEIIRRWGRFLRWEVYPKKNMHTFRDAFQGQYLRELPSLPQTGSVIPLFTDSGG